MKVDGKQVTAALDVLARALAQVADGADQCPEVDIHVTWLDVSAIDRNAWIPTISVDAKAFHKIRLEDLCPTTP